MEQIIYVGIFAGVVAILTALFYAKNVGNYKIDNEKVKEITKVLYEKTPGEIFDLYNKCKEINLSYFKSVTKRLGSNFEDFIFESEAGEAGEKIVRENIGRVFEESEGAVIFRG